MICTKNKDRFHIQYWVSYADIIVSKLDFLAVFHPFMLRLSSVFIDQL